MVDVSVVYEGGGGVFRDEREVAGAGVGGEDGAVESVEELVGGVDYV